MKIWFQNRRYKLKRQIQEKGVEQTLSTTKPTPPTSKLPRLLEAPITSCPDFENSMMSFEEAFETETCMPPQTWQGYIPPLQPWNSHPQQQVHPNRNHVWNTWNLPPYARFNNFHQHHNTSGFYAQGTSISSTDSTTASPAGLSCHRGADGVRCEGCA